jgi:hypothetical protein
MFNKNNIQQIKSSLIIHVPSKCLSIKIYMYLKEHLHKPIIAECGETENDTLVPDDISTIRQAVYRVRRRTQPKLPKSREETHVNLKDYEFNSTSCPKNNIQQIKSSLIIHVPSKCLSIKIYMYLKEHLTYL